MTQMRMDAAAVDLPTSDRRTRWPQGKLEKKRKNLLGPPAGKKMLLFIDDLNMPALEEYGAQPPNELLRQVIDQGGFYDTQKLFFKNVKDTLVASACAPPGGGRNEVSPRLTRHFSLVWLENISPSSMKVIFSQILQGFLQAVLPSLAANCGPIVDASVEIYQRVEDEMLPTPAKSHYTFNLRDLSKVFQGVLMIKARHVEDKDALLKLWVHEECRVFRDRLIDADDRALFNGMLKEMLSTRLETEWEIDAFNNLAFGDYLNREEKEYQPVTNPTVLHELLVEYLEEYNMNFPSQMHLVFFDDAIAHISRIARVLRQPRGNALLVGVGGSGRQSLCRLSSFIADYKLKSIEITRGYGVTEFHEELKVSDTRALCGHACPVGGRAATVSCLHTGQPAGDKVCCCHLPPSPPRRSSSCRRAPRTSRPSSSSPTRRSCTRASSRTSTTC